MPSLPLTFSLAPFPSGSAMNADEFGQQLIANLSAVLNGSIVLGQTFGTAPAFNIGPWFNGTTWFIWNPVLGSYTPIAIQAPFSAIHNGSMNIWQRGTSFPAISSGYTADRFALENTLVTGVATISRHALNLTGTTTYPNTVFALRITVTTAQTTISANEYFSVYQAVEKTNARPLFDNPTSLSLVLKASVAGTYCVSIRDIGSDWSYITECIVTAAGVPQAFTFPSIPTFPTSTGNWGTLETDGSFSVNVSATSGITYRTPADIWSVGNFLASPNQTNLFGTIGNTLDITLIQHEPGLICNPFIFTPFDEDLRKCQRYYCQSYDYGTFPGAVTSFGSGCVLYPGIASVAAGTTRFPQPMRSGPVFSSGLNIYAPSTGAINRLYDNAGTIDRVVTSVTGSGSKTGFSELNGTSFTSGNVLAFQYTASADL